jgi:quinolinate synthase
MGAPSQIMLKVAKKVNRPLTLKVLNYPAMETALNTLFPLSAPLKSLEDYERYSDDELYRRIMEIKKDYGPDLVILGHHYQRPTITHLSDFVGDSFGLSEKAAKSSGKNIVFCGVRFMAESAAILCKPDQRVFHPDPEAGCPMADMANMEQVMEAWTKITQWNKSKIIPVTYMNSTADLKAFCGERDGIVCTSSNAEKIFHWSFDRGEKIFFFPDEHLGRNTAKKLNISQDEVLRWDPKKPDGGLTSAEVERAKVIVWAGHCPVHMEFKVRDIKNVRKYFQGCKVVVHPECEKEVVEASDASGSTDFIVKYIAAQPAGSVTFVGTEVNLITRLQMMYPDRKVYKLQRSLCLTMYQINLANICYALDHLDTLEVVTLPETVKHNARVALDRMLALA